MLFRLIFFVFPFLVWLALWPVFVKKVASRKIVRIALWFALGLALAKFAAFRLFGGSSFLPVLPESVTWAWSFAYSCAMTLAVCAVFAAVCAKIAQLAHRHASSERFTATAAAVGALATTAYGIAESWCIPDVKVREVPLDGLPEAFDGYTICHLSDLHISKAAPARRTAKIVETANSLGADLVCITGDIVDAPIDIIEEDVAPLAKLHAKDGVLACAGNHEFYADYEAWKPFFARCGIDILDNAHRIIAKNSAKLAVGGIIDPQGISFARRGLGKWEGPDARLAFAGAGEDAFKILMAHRPVQLQKHAALGVKLQLSGHTHGGQIPGIAQIVAAANENHVRGFYEEYGTTLFVHPGTGQWAGFPMRIADPAEITLLRLVRMQHRRNSKAILPENA